MIEPARRRILTTYSSANENLPEAYGREADKLGSWIGKNGVTYCFGGHTGGLMGRVMHAVIAERDTQPDPATHSHLISVPYAFYYSNYNFKENDHYFQEVIVKHDLHEQQAHFYNNSDDLVALPGGIGTMAEICSARRLMGTDPGKRLLWLVNVEGCFDGFKHDCDMMQINGTMQPEENANIIIVNSVEEFIERHPSTQPQTPHIVKNPLLPTELIVEGNDLVLPPGGGVDMRVTFWNTLEALRSNKEFTHKRFFVVGLRGEYDGLKESTEMMTRNGTAVASDFARLHFI